MGLEFQSEITARDGTGPKGWVESGTVEKRENAW